MKNRKNKFFMQMLAFAVSISAVCQTVPVCAADTPALKMQEEKEQEMSEETSSTEGIAFSTAGSDSIYEGLPLFDGIPAHLDAYVDTLCDYLGLEGMLRIALGYRGDYTLRYGEHAGKVIPGSERFSDHVQGVSTDFPAIIALGQTWDRELVQAVGDVVGTEILFTSDFLDTISNFSAVTSTAMQDLRVNPLSGRFDEGFGEDAYLVSEMVQAMASGASGIYEEGNEDGFWLKCIATTKHYTNYAGQFFRRSSNVANGIRGVMELHAKNIKKGIASGAVSGFMSSYGRTAGIPNTISPLIQWIQTFSPWGKDGGTYVVADYSSDSHMASKNAIGNGYDTSYVKTYAQALSMMLMARGGQGAVGERDDKEKPENGQVTKMQDQVLIELQNGSYGFSAEDVKKAARGQLIPLIRTGVFNERDEKGYPIGYPFTELSKGAGAIIYDCSNEEHQRIALKAAQDSLVLLKNDNGLLPLSKDSKVVVSGVMADARFKTTYAVGQTPDLEHAGLTIGDGLKSVGKNVTVFTDGNIIALKSALNGKYIKVKEDGTMSASAETVQEASAFEAYSWGQGDGYSYLCVDKGSANGRWLSFLADKEGNAKLDVTGEQTLNQKATKRSPVSYSATMPARFSAAENEDGTTSILLGCYDDSFFGAEDSYYQKTRVMETKENGIISCSEVIGDAAGEKLLRGQDSGKFEVETIRETGTLAGEAGAEYAVVVVGAPTRHSAGEGNDRSDLALGRDQYELVSNVSEQYPGKTIVVVNSVFPVCMEEIQNNEKVAAILYAPYGGQYDGYAVGQTIFGESTPAGKLTATWYADMSAFPLLNEYSIPDGENEKNTLEDLAPRYTVDMGQADAAANRLTYQYTNAPVTYEFGYGLSYTSYEYGQLTAVKNEDGSLTAKITVTNTGEKDGAEIVQLYASNPDSAYGSYAPGKVLAAFEKVWLKAGETKEVSMEISRESLELWNPNRNAYEVEKGTYLLEAGSSSRQIESQVQVEIEGEDFDGLDLVSQAVSVYDKSFAASQNVIYCEYSKAHTAENLKKEILIGGYSAVEAAGEDVWTAFNGVRMDGIRALTISAAYGKSGAAKAEIHLDTPDGEKIAEFEIGQTETVSYPAGAAADYEITELGYEELTAEVQKESTGVHDLYLILKTPGLRVYEIQGKK